MLDATYETMLSLMSSHLVMSYYAMPCHAMSYYVTFGMCRSYATRLEEMRASFLKASTVSEESRHPTSPTPSSSLLVEAHRTRSPSRSKSPLLEISTAMEETTTLALPHSHSHPHPHPHPPSPSLSPVPTLSPTPLPSLTPAVTVAEPSKEWTALPEPGSTGRSEQAPSREWKRCILFILREVSNHRHGTVFLTSVKEEDAPFYYEVVNKPLSLQLIKSRIRDDVSP